MPKQVRGYVCSFKYCRSSQKLNEPNVSFFRFPKNPERCRQWIEGCKRFDLRAKDVEILYNYYRVCSKHFTPDMFLNDLKNRLQPHAYPNLQREFSFDVNEPLDDVTPLWSPEFVNVAELDTEPTQPQESADTSDTSVSTPSNNDKIGLPEVTINDQTGNIPNVIHLTPENISKVCRTCLKETEVKNLYETLYNNISLGKILELCSPIKVDREDILSQNMCNRCIVPLIKAYRFYTKCKKSESTLQEFKLMLDKAKEKQKLIEVYRKKPQLLDHDYEYTNKVSDVHKQVLKPNNSSGPTVTRSNGKCDSSSTSAKYVKRFYLMEGDKKMEINENQAKTLVMKSSNKPQTEVESDSAKNKDLPINLTGENRTDETPEELPNDTKDSSENDEYDYSMLKELLLLRKNKKLVRTRNTTDTSKQGRNAVLKKALKIIKSVNLRKKLSVSSTRNEREKCKVKRQLFPGKCKECDEPYANRREYLEHCKLTKHYFNSFKCEICGKVFAQKHHLKTHVAIHGNEKPYMCDKCGHCFRKLSGLTNHMKVHSETLQGEANQVDNYWVCKVCGKSFLNRADITRHRRIVHGREKKICCEMCGKLVAGRSNLLQHKKRMHMNLKPQKCVICGKGFFTKTHLQKHMETHKKEQHNCKLCKFYTKYKSKFIQHMSLRHPGADETVTQEEEILTLECPFCNEVCQNKQSITIHLSEGHGQLVCNYCGCFFETQEDLNKHRNTHGDVKDYSCRYCGKVSLNWTDLFLHLSVHNSINNRCLVCSKVFSSMEMLNDHMSRHKRFVKRFKCQYCEKSFIHRTSKYAHERIHMHEKTYVCDTCGAVLLDISDFNEHQQLHVAAIEIYNE